MQEYAVHRITDGFWDILDVRVRCLLFEGQEHSVLVDTGFGTGNLAETVRMLTKKPVMLVNTHADIDHIGKNADFGPAHMHPAEFALYHSGAFVKSPVVPLWEGDVLDLGKRKLEVIHIPGHTPGSIALLDRANRFLIGGDSIATGPIHMFGSTRDFPAYIASMQKLLSIADAFDVVYQSHFTLEVNPSILHTLLEGAKQTYAGKIEGVAPELDNRLYTKAKLYTYKDISFWGSVDGYND